MEDSAPDPAEPSEFEPDAGLTPAPQIVCPQCGQSVDPATASGPILQCANCGTQFFPPSSENDADNSNEEDDEEKGSEAELSELRIRQLSTLRRTAYRTRSYLLIGTLACLGFAIQLLIFFAHGAQGAHHLGSSSIACLLFALAGLIGSFKFGMRAMEVQQGINADLRARALEEQEAAKHEPDLSTLSDGSQHARNLARMFAKEQEPEKEPAPESPSNPES